MLPKMRLDLLPPPRSEGPWRDDDLEGKLEVFLRDAGIPFIEMKVSRYPDVGIVKGQVYLSLPEGADVEAEAEKIHRTKFDGRTIEAHPWSAAPKREEQSQEQKIVEQENPGEGGLPRM
jgi:hypothetical protein